MADSVQGKNFDQLLNVSTPHAAKTREEADQRLAVAAERSMSAAQDEILESDPEKSASTDSMPVPPFLRDDRRDGLGSSTGSEAEHGFMQSIRRRLDEQALRYEGVLEWARRERFAGHSPDGMVTAVLGGEGNLLELTVGRASSGDLSASVLQALNEAEALVRHKTNEVMAEAGLTLREESDDDADRLVRQLAAPVDYHSISAVEDPRLKNRMAEALENYRATVLSRMESRGQAVRTEVGEGLGYITTDMDGSVKEVRVEQSVWRKFGKTRVAEEILLAVQNTRRSF